MKKAITLIRCDGIRNGFTAVQAADRSRCPRLLGDAVSNGRPRIFPPVDRHAPQCATVLTDRGDLQ